MAVPFIMLVPGSKEEKEYITNLLKKYEQHIQKNNTYKKAPQNNSD